MESQGGSFLPLSRWPSDPGCQFVLLLVSSARSSGNHRQRVDDDVAQVRMARGAPANAIAWPVAFFVLTAGSPSTPTASIKARNGSRRPASGSSQSPWPLSPGRPGWRRGPTRQTLSGTSGAQDHDLVFFKEGRLAKASRSHLIYWCQKSSDGGRESFVGWQLVANRFLKNEDGMDLENTGASLGHGTIPSGFGAKGVCPDLTWEDLHSCHSEDRNCQAEGGR